MPLFYHTGMFEEAHFGEELRASRSFDARTFCLISHTSSLSARRLVIAGLAARTAPSSMPLLRRAVISPLLWSLSSPLHYLVTAVSISHVKTHHKCQNGTRLSWSAIMPSSEHRELLIRRIADTKFITASDGVPLS